MAADSRPGGAVAGCILALASSAGDAVAGVGTSTYAAGTDIIRCIRVSVIAGSAVGLGRVAAFSRPGGAVAGSSIVALIRRGTRDALAIVGTTAYTAGTHIITCGYISVIAGSAVALGSLGAADSRSGGAVASSCNVALI